MTRMEVLLVFKCQSHRNRIEWPPLPTYQLSFILYYLGYLCFNLINFVTEKNCVVTKNDGNQVINHGVTAWKTGSNLSEKVSSPSSTPFDRQRVSAYSYVKEKRRLLKRYFNLKARKLGGGMMYPHAYSTHPKCPYH